eukprot:TRINITY_DN1196_c0_g1_i1.p1 TRINITY_DN1196_c0_g1~~TRINITY_DN1196_c0_g1_i1.p1  ORF type:complete len:187 (-),score=55.61 TRINITY_DN1196_c0_g1_i1:93-653(-)
MATSLNNTFEKPSVQQFVYFVIENKLKTDFQMNTTYLKLMNHFFQYSNTYQLPPPITHEEIKLYEKWKQSINLGPPCEVLGSLFLKTILNPIKELIYSAFQNDFSVSSILLDFFSSLEELVDSFHSSDHIKRYNIFTQITGVSNIQLQQLQQNNEALKDSKKYELSIESQAAKRLKSSDSFTIENK